MNTYRINFKWHENTGAVYTTITRDFQIRKDCKTPAEAARKFSAEWTGDNAYQIISIERTFGTGGPAVFHPVRFSQKNWAKGFK